LAVIGNGTTHRLKIFSGRANPTLAQNIAKHLGVALGNINLGNFPDGETFVRIDEDVRGRDVFIVQPTCPPVNENLMELLIILDAFKRASPARLTAVIPYYGYARQDRKDMGRVPISAKLAADLLTTAGAHRVLALDLHAAQIQGFFNIPVDHLYAVKEVTAHVRSLNVPPEDLVVLSTDEGNVKKSLKYQQRLGERSQIAVVDKRRTSATETKAAHLIGASVDGKTVVIFDDMISTGSSMANAAELARKQGAKKIYVCATHGVLVDRAVERLKNAGIEQIAVTDSIPLAADKQIPNIKIISVAALLANAIIRIHGNESVSVLFNDDQPPPDRR
jgi:ribose-phosphate pyrophosphokinase